MSPDGVVVVHGLYFYCTPVYNKIKVHQTTTTSGDVMSVFSSIYNYFMPPKLTPEYSAFSGLHPLGPAVSTVHSEEDVYIVGEGQNGPVLTPSLSQYPSVIVCSTDRYEVIDVIRDMTTQALAQGKRVHIASHIGQFHPADAHATGVVACGSSDEDAARIIEDVAQRVLFYASSRSRIDTPRVLVIPDPSVIERASDEMISHLSAILLNGHRFNISVILGCSHLSALPMSSIIPSVKGSVVHLTDDMMSARPISSYAA